ncbi:MAG: hypothetical protein R3Y28_08445, partial [Candidatus Gastranaerophilales bacterium]
GGGFKLKSPCEYMIEIERIKDYIFNSLYFAVDKTKSDSLANAGYDGAVIPLLWRGCNEVDGFRWRRNKIVTTPPYRHPSTGGEFRPKLTNTW